MDFQRQEGLCHLEKVFELGLCLGYIGCRMNQTYEPLVEKALNVNVYILTIAPCLLMMEKHAYTTSQSTSHIIYYCTYFFTIFQSMFQPHSMSRMVLPPVRTTLPE